MVAGYDFDRYISIGRYMLDGIAFVVRIHASTLQVSPGAVPFPKFVLSWAGVVCCLLTPGLHPDDRAQPCEGQTCAVLASQARRGQSTSLALQLNN